MLSNRINFHLHWDEMNRLHWGDLSLAVITSVEKYGGRYFRIDGLWEDHLLEEYEPDIMLCSPADEEGTDEAEFLLIADDGAAHERLKSYYAQILSKGTTEIVVTE